MTSGIADKVRRLDAEARGDAPESGDLPTRYARSKDARGFATVVGMPVRLGAFEWFVPKRRAPVRIMIGSGEVRAEQGDEGAKERRMLERLAAMQNADCSENELLACGAEYLLSCVRENYDLPDEVAERILNANLQETESAIEMVLADRLLPAERGEFAVRMMALAKRWAELHSMLFAEQSSKQEVSACTDGAA